MLILHDMVLLHMLVVLEEDGGMALLATIREQEKTLLLVNQSPSLLFLILKIMERDASFLVL